MVRPMQMVGKAAELGDVAAPFIQLDFLPVGMVKQEVNTSRAGFAERVGQGDFLIRGR